jgi:hypothetical protein
MKEITEKKVAKTQQESGIHVSCRGMAELWDDSGKYHPKRIDELESEIAKHKPEWQKGKPLKDRILCRVKKYISDENSGVGWYLAEDGLIAGVCGDWDVDPTKEEWMIIPEAPKKK